MAGRHDLIRRMDPYIWPSQGALEAFRTEPLGSAVVREGLLEEGTYTKDLSGWPSESHTAFFKFPHRQYVAFCFGGLLLCCWPNVSSPFEVLPLS